MTGKSKKYMFWGKMANMFGVALAIASLVTNLLPAGTVSAHNSTITGSVACQSDGTKLVTWTISQDMGSSRPMDITAINQTLSGVGVGTIVKTSVQGTQTFAGDNHSTITLTFTGHWAFDNYIRNFSGTVNLGSGTCTPETKVDVCHWTASGHYNAVNVSVPSVDWWNDHGHGQHDHDIWASFTVNGTLIPAQGDQSILANGCVVPPPPASASISAGACSWSQVDGSLTDVTITLDHASLTINSQIYTQDGTTTIHLTPGTYHYTWTADSGYSGSGSGDLTIGDCTPPLATASVSAGTCSWSEAGGSQTPVTITLNGASLLINGVTYTSSTTIDLGPGTYPYSWAAQSGYRGSGSGSIEIRDCTPGRASASVIAGACFWSEGTGSQTPVTITLTGASLLINGVTYTSSTSIDLAPGSYPYSWTAQVGYTGSGYGTLDIGDCTPPTASVSVNPGSCQWTAGAGSLTPVSYTIDGATLTITKDGTLVSYGPFTTSGSINLGPGNYSYVWTALSGHKGSGSGNFTINDCTPPDASVSVTPGSCQWTAGAGSITPVSYTIDGAILTFTKDGTLISYGPFGTSGSIDLGPGDYHYSWTAIGGYQGSGSGAFTVNDCTPPDATASVTPGDCSWSKETGPQTPVTIILTGASLLINGVTYTSSTTIDLGPGTYPYSWTAQTGYKGSGSGSLVIGDCTPGNARASISTGTCSFTKESGAQTPVTITVTGATLEINGGTYTSSTIIDLEPGIYPYSWTAQTGYTGSGSGSLEIANCNPADPLVKTADPLTYSSVGAVINYSYVVTNLGNVPLTGLIVTDDKATVSCPKDTLAVNESITCTASYTILQGDLDAGSVTNHAGSLTDQTGPVYDQATVTAVIRTGLTIDKSVTETTYTLVGDLLHYSYLVTNTGNVTLTGVGVTDDKVLVTCPKTSLAPTESMTCTATYVVTNADMGLEKITNTAYASGLYGTVPVTSNPDSAIVVRFLKLILSSKCAADPAANDGWQVVNNNNDAVGFEYALDGGASGTGTAPANSTTPFDTPLADHGTGVMSLRVGGVLQNNATAATGCNNPGPQPTPEPTLVLLIPVTGAGGPTVLIPVTGVDMGLVGRALPGTLFGLSFSFFGLGFVLTGLARRHED